MTNSRWLLRATAAISIALWTAALFERVDVYYGHGRDEYNYGWWMLALGWLGIFGLNFAWFANFLVFMFWYKFFCGRVPGMRATLITSLLALSALGPYFLLDLEYDGRFHPELFRGPAVWIWLLSFAPVLATTALRRLLHSN
jgi:hypothetical protein